MKAANGELLFVALGAKRAGFGRHEEGLPWRALRGFSIERADALFGSNANHFVRELFAGKSVAAKVALHSGAHVISAEFNGFSPIRINEALSEPATLRQLHAELRRLFVEGRSPLVDSLCTDEAYKWPVEDGRVRVFKRGTQPTYVASRTLLSRLDRIGPIAVWLGFGVFVLWLGWRLFTL